MAVADFLGVIPGRCPLERTAVEAEQVFSTGREEPAPVKVSRLGLDAYSYWFPGERQVMTTDGVRLITATIEWPQAPAGKRRALAVVAARPFLGKLHPKAADPGGS